MHCRPRQFRIVCFHDLLKRSTPKSVKAAAALAFCGAIPFAAAPAPAQDSDCALLATFCDAANIKGKTCARANGYPNAPKKGCDVTLTGDRSIGKFLGGNPLLLASYESGCEAHTTDNGGVVVLEQSGGAWVFRGYQPGMQATCITLPKGAEQDALACLTGSMGQASWRPAWR